MHGIEAALRGEAESLCLDGDLSQTNRRWPLKNKTVDKKCLGLLAGSGWHVFGEAVLQL